MSEAKELVRRGFQEGFNLGNLDVSDEALSADHHDHEAADQSLRGPAAEDLLNDSAGLSR